MTPLIHLHGALGAASQFQALVHELHDFENFSFDFEGHGNAAPSTRPYRIEHFAENLEHFIAMTSLAPARIVGYSMGGYVALYLASKHPELIHSVITLGTKFGWTPEGAQHETRFLDTEKMRTKVPEFANELQVRHEAHGWETVVSKTRELMLDLGENPRLTAQEYSSIRCAVRIGVGDRDNMVSLDETIAAQKQISGSELYVLPATQHPLERVNPRRWSLMIRDFFGH